MPPESATPPAGPEDPIRSANELAALVGKNRGTVSRWLRRVDWIFGKPPWPRSILPQILTWLADTLSPRDSLGASAETSPKSPVDDITDLRKQKLASEIRKLKAQADAAETELARVRGELLDAAAVEKEWASVGSLIRASLANLPAQVVPLGLTLGLPIAAAIVLGEKVEDIIRDVLRSLSRESHEEAAAGEETQSASHAIAPSRSPSAAGGPVSA